MSIQVMRQVDIDVDQVDRQTRTCLGCGTQFTLFFNDGAGDWKLCCGYMYELVPVRYDYVVKYHLATGES